MSRPVVTRIRPAGASDAPAIADIYRPAVVGSPISFEYDAPHAEEMGRRIAQLTPRFPWLVSEVDGIVMGYAYAGPHRERHAYQWSVDVSAYVHADARRAGVARALYSSLFAVLVLQGFRNACAGITLPNDASVGFHTALGFTPVGVYRKVGYKLGAWHDVGWFERELAPRVHEPPAPTPLSAIAGTAALRDALDAGLSPR